MDDRWIKLMTSNKVIDVQEEVSGLIFLDAKPSYPVTVTNNKTINGVDGELTGAISFAPFNLLVRFGVDGQDEASIDIAEQKLRHIFNRRENYYLFHSQMPGVKYLVENPEISPEIKDFSSIELEANFSVKTGYSESLMTTDNFSLNSDYWQFGNGLVTDPNIKYVHTKRNFQIYNGSTDTVTPIHRHQLITTMNINAPNGFTLHNKTTGDKFTYKKKIRDTDTLVLNGVYPFKNKQHCGIDTNHEYITLAEGYNDFEVLGDGVEVKEIKFTFNFVYR
ncbi:phage tail domain-containing protein [Mammaliicoccus sp. J-M39]|uniref:phage tail domain-containing protein n=1 Tax=Mammaliicoccus sp. J-M39 TaxID=2898698 RepID=UPI001EFBA8AC|nr:phage tail domain-containing protein [Mammaliicoccus sp. J-M39]